MANNEKIKLAITESHDLLRSTLISSLSTDNRMEVLIEVRNGQELMNHLEHVVVDVVILDVRMHMLDGYETLKLLKENYPALKVVMYSNYSGDHFIRFFLENGASAYLLKGCDLEDILNTITTVFKNGHNVGEP